MTIPTKSFNIGDEFALTKDGQIKILTLTRKTNTMLIMNNNTRWQYRSYARAGCEFRCHGVNHQYEIGFLAFPNHNAPLTANLMNAVASLMAANPKKLEIMRLSSGLKNLGFDQINDHAKAHAKLGGGTQEALRYVICSVYNRGLGKANQIRG